MLLVQCILFWPPLNSILEFCIRHSTSSIVCFTCLFFLLWFLAGCSVLIFSHVRPLGHPHVRVVLLHLLQYISCGMDQLKADLLAWLVSLGLPQFFQVPSTKAWWRVGKEWKQPCSHVKSVLVCSLFLHMPWIWWLYGYGYRVDQPEWRSWSKDQVMWRLWAWGLLMGMSWHHKWMDGDAYL